MTPEIEAARERVHDAVRALMELSRADGGMLASWLLVLERQEVAGDEIVSHYDWMASFGLPYHASLGLLCVGDEIVRVSSPLGAPAVQEEE